MRCLGGVLGGLCLCVLFFAPSAEGSFEQVGHFGTEEIPERFGGTQLQEVSSMAVNYTGAGGVPLGTVYAGVNAGQVSVTSFTAQGEFRGVWADENATAGDTVSIAVDQVTGYVYVLGAQGQRVTVLSADGSEPIAEFGEGGTQTVEEAPEKLHDARSIAVDDSGIVYLADRQSGENRIMLFEPQSPGDYEHYVYTGRANDIDVLGTRIALDYAGNIYASTDQEIREYNLADPTSPVCEYELAAGDIRGMTPNPANGEIFYFSSKNKKIHQLAACNGEGEFVETGAITPTPKVDDVFPNALALNPSLAWEASRPAGVLYAGGRFPFEGFIFAPAEIYSPSVESESVSAVTTTRALFGATINPQGSPTRYAFQYLTQVEYDANPTERFAGATEIPEGGAPLPALKEGLNVSVSPSGLLPGTEYRFRAIATSHCNPEEEEELCEDSAEGEVFRTLPLPEEPCAGEGCGGLIPPPVLEAPIVPAAGKAHRPRCKRHFVRRHGRCVRWARHRRHRNGAER